MSVNINLCPLPYSGEGFVNAVLREVLAEHSYETEATFAKEVGQPCYKIKSPGNLKNESSAYDSNNGWIFLYRNLCDIIPLFAQAMIKAGEPTVPVGYQLEDAIEMVISHNLRIVVPPLIRLQRECRGVSIRYEELVADPRGTLEKTLLHFGLEIDRTLLAQAIERHSQSLQALHESTQLPGGYRQYFDVQTSNLFRIFLGDEQLALGYHMDDLPASPTPLSKGLSFFGTRRRPYYISAQDYRHSSAGIRCLHYLCHALKQLGEEAYIVHASELNERLQTPPLTSEIVHKHYLAGKHPIVVYPEVVKGNPLSIPGVARWLLNRPGHLGGDTDFNPAEEIFYFARWCLPEGVNGKILNLPTIDGEIFNNENNRHDQARSGRYYYANKYYLSGAPLCPEITGEAISLGQEKSLTPENIADILRTAEALYCYELSSIIPEALSCGCPVIIVPSEYWNNHGDPRIFQNPGIELASTQYALAIAKAEISLYRTFTPDQFNYYWWQVERFIQTTQDQPLPNKESLGNNAPQDMLLGFWLLDKEDRQKKASTLAAFYDQILSQPASKASARKTDTSINLSSPLSNQEWLKKRKASEWDYGTTSHQATANSRNTTSFSLLIRLNQGEIPKLADTLDSLAQQLYDNWSLDVISTLPAPDAVKENSLFGWHTIETIEQADALIHSLGLREGCDWIVELPPGAVLDPLYLLRLADEIHRAPDIRAFFVDDYTITSDGICSELRLKPGLNIEHLRSMDLAGPICIHRDSWVVVQGRGTSNGSPWFSQLLQITDKFGWSSIKHIPDALISYPDTFPTNTDACLLALYQHLAKNTPGSEILAATEKSWRIRYPLSRTPRVAIAVLSSNQPDLLRRCLESITQKTGYPDFEILLQLSPEEKSDRFLAEWIAQQQDGSRFQLTVVDRSEADDLSAQCNRAVRIFSGEFLAAIREDIVIIQPEWLEELVRTALQCNIAVVAPRVIRAGDAHIRSVGQVLGLRGTLTSPYANEATLKDNGYLDYLQVARDVSSVSNACALLNKAAFDALDGIDTNLPDPNFAWADFCLKQLAAGHRLLCQPLATVVDCDTPPLDIEADFERHTHRKLAKAQGERLFNQRWLAAFPADPFWNPNLSLHSEQIVPETDYLPQWRHLPDQAYRIFARPITGAQATYRITSPLQALVNAGRVAQCVWPMGSSPRDELSMAELARLSADTVIVQNYIHEHHLAALENWRRLPNRPFTVYALDDLITRMAENSHFQKNFPVNSAGRLKFALERCDRLVVSTDFLAEIYAGLSKDILVVPNRLESALWLPLVSRKRTSKKPRIGWAGGSGHYADLTLLKEVIERTRHEADWVFFGMCPDEIRPLITEFHGLEQLAAYPAKLASLNLDIAVAPLEQIPFNQAKSNLRLLEYGALGIPVVCTDITPYRNSPAHCVANTTDAWVNALRERINDPDAREREGIILRQWVRQHYLLENHLDEWLAAHQPE